VTRLGDQRFAMTCPRGSSTMQAHPTSGGNGLKVTRSTSFLQAHCCGTVTRGKQDSERFEHPFWNIKIAPGVDPALFLCFVAIMDDTFQNS
jgi:hypothetical protein